MKPKADFERILKFLAALNRNNNREWFEKHKDTYLLARDDFQLFISDLVNRLTAFEPALMGLDPKKLPFRIYRDVRFSKDKRPYKTNMGAGISPKGKMVQEPGYYIHIEPGKSFLAGGIYMPDPENLGKIRQEIDYNGGALEKILRDKAFRKWYGAFDDFDKMKTAPKGYAKDHPRIEWLKHRSFIVSHEFTDREVKSPSFAATVAKAASALKPMNDFLREAIA